MLMSFSFISPFSILLATVIILLAHAAQSTPEKIRAFDFSVLPFAFRFMEMPLSSFLHKAQCGSFPFFLS
jgi:hypothetical protein